MNNDTETECLDKIQALDDKNEIARSGNRRHRSVTSADGVIDRSECVFCRISDKKESEDKILFENEKLVVFPTIRPAATFHHLVVTKVHIESCESLTYDELSLLDRMVKIGQEVFIKALQNSPPDDGAAESEIPKPLMGFHFPPHNTVDHIHLHVIYPTNTSEFMARRRYRPNTSWFVSPEYVKNRISERFQKKGSSTPELEVALNDRSECVFCRISDKIESEDKILFENDELLVFPSIRPAATFHHLVVTKVHIKNCESLSYDQLTLLDRMVKTGQEVFTAALLNSLPDDGADKAETPEPLMGFHFPPYKTVDHIHLHVIYPTNTPEFMARKRYRPNTSWFVSPEYVKNLISERFQPKDCSTPDIEVEKQ